ncbi:MAG: FAD-dependent oxidoreductase, partial [Gammaproteobacteria bacterium]
MEAASGDVIILGNGITASALALVLARQGVATTLIDPRPHPRFALGESLLKPTVLWMRVLAERYGVDELAAVANLNRIHDEIAPTSGVKKGFGFVRHAPGALATTEQWWANIAVSYGEEVLEAHLFRQDVDAWLCARAAAAGCRLLHAEV